MAINICIILLSRGFRHGLYSPFPDASGSTPIEAHISWNCFLNCGFFLISFLCLAAKSSKFSLNFSICWVICKENFLLNTCTVQYCVIRSYEESLPIRVPKWTLIRLQGLFIWKTSLLTFCSNYRIKIEESTIQIRHDFNYERLAKDILHTISIFMSNMKPLSSK